MKQIFTFLFAIFLFLETIGQVCTPKPGLQPNETDPDGTTTNFPKGEFNIPYQAVYSIAVPTSSGPLTVINIKIDSISNLPQGLTWTPGTPDSTWLAGTTGCLLISGTPTKSGTFPLILHQKTKVTYMSQEYNVPLINNKFKIIIDESVGITEEINSEFQVLSTYPNPANDVLTIEYVASREGKIQIEVYNILGSIQYTLASDITAGKNTIEINTKNLISGLYFVKMKTVNSEKTLKVFVQ